VFCTFSACLEQLIALHYLESLGVLSSTGANATYWRVREFSMKLGSGQSRSSQASLLSGLKEAYRLIIAYIVFTNFGEGGSGQVLQLILGVVIHFLG